MATEKKVIIKLEADSKQATKSMKDVEKGAKNAGKSAEDSGNAATAAAGSFTIMGTSLNTVTFAMTKLKTVAKAMFSTIRLGIISTGIGALVLVVISLLSYFTKTQKGADALKVVFNAIGAAVAVITDRISTLGSAITKVFSGDFKGAAEDVKGAFVGIGTEIKNDMLLMAELTRRLQAVRDAEIAFGVERAKTNRTIAEARLIAEDENVAIEDRIVALNKANDLELETTAIAIALAKEKLAAKQLEVDMSESMVEDFEMLAQLETTLIDLETASFSKRKRLATAVETLRVEGEAAAKSRHNAAKARAKERLKLEQDFNKQLRNAQIANIEDEKTRLLAKAQFDFALQKSELKDKFKNQKELDNLLEQLEISHNANIASINNDATEKAELKRKEDSLKERDDKIAIFDAGLSDELERLEIRKNLILENTDSTEAEKAAIIKEYDDAVAANEQTVQSRRLKMASDTLNGLSDLMSTFQAKDKEKAKKLFKVTKALSLAQALVSTYSAGAAVMAETKGDMFARIAGMIAVVGAGMAQVIKIKRTKFDGGGAVDGGGGGGGGGGLQTIAAAMPAGFADTGGTNSTDIASAISQQNQTPVKAYVIAQEVTDTQQINEEIQIQSSL